MKSEKTPTTVLDVKWRGVWKEVYRYDSHCQKHAKLIKEKYYPKAKTRIRSIYVTP